MKRNAIAAGASFVSNLACLAVATQIPAAAGWGVTAIAFYSIALALGFLHGLFLAEPRVAPVAGGAFAAALLLCIPVILVTYGFALAGAPLVLAYVFLVAIGTYIGMHRRARANSAARPGQR